MSFLAEHGNRAPKIGGEEVRLMQQAYWLGWLRAKGIYPQSVEELNEKIETWASGGAGVDPDGNDLLMKQFFTVEPLAKEEEFHKGFKA